MDGEVRRTYDVMCSSEMDDTVRGIVYERKRGSKKIVSTYRHKIQCRLPSELIHQYY